MTSIFSLKILGVLGLSGDKKDEFRDEADSYRPHRYTTRVLSAPVGSGLAMPLWNRHTQLFPWDMGMVSRGRDALNAQGGLCACERLEAHVLPGHAVGWWQDMQ